MQSKAAIQVREGKATGGKRKKGGGEEEATPGGEININPVPILHQIKPIRRQLDWMFWVSGMCVSRLFLIARVRSRGGLLLVAFETPGMSVETPSTQPPLRPASTFVSQLVQTSSLRDFPAYLSL